MSDELNESELLIDLLVILDEHRQYIPYEYLTSEGVTFWLHDNSQRIEALTGQFTPRPFDCIQRALAHYNLQLSLVNSVYHGAGAKYFLTQLADDEHESDEV